MSAEGLDELEMKLNQLADIDLKKAVSDAVQTVRSAAMSVHVDTGELQQSIHADVEENGDTVTGTCWTNKPYAPYLEFGTGPKGQENHAGISPEITPAYTQNPWWIHESQVDRRVAGEIPLVLPGCSRWPLLSVHWTARLSVHVSGVKRQSGSDPGRNES